jgi:hypothetical protein
MSHLGTKKHKRSIYSMILEHQIKQLMMKYFFINICSITLKGTLKLQKGNSILTKNQAENTQRKSQATGILEMVNSSWDSPFIFL